MKWIPRLGSIVAGEKSAYQYLVESIKKFPDANTFAEMIQKSGFDDVYFKRKTFGVVAIHSGYKK